MARRSFDSPRFALALLVLAPAAPGAAAAAGADGRAAAAPTRRRAVDLGSDGDDAQGARVENEADGAARGDAAPEDALPDRGAAPDARVAAWVPKLFATVKPVVAALGDPITVKIKVTSDRDVSVALPLRLELAPLTELSRKESTREIGGVGHSAKREHTFVLEVTAYELGAVTLPPIEVTALGPNGELLTLKTAAMPLKIKSLLANEPKPQLKGLAPVVTVFQRDWLLLYVIVGVGTAGLIVLATLLINRRLRARREALRPPPPPVPAHVIALRRLAELDVEQQIAEERFKELYFALSEIIRGYVGGRFGFDAMEMTTAEIRQTLMALRIPAEIRKRVDELLTAWDLVKFAKYRPEPDAAREAAAEAEALVRETMHQVSSVREPDEAAKTTPAEQPTPRGEVAKLPQAGPLDGGAQR